MVVIFSLLGVLMLAVSPVNCQGDFECLAEIVSANHLTDARCIAILANESLGRDVFCNDTECVDFFVSAIDMCGFPCNPVTLGCNNSLIAQNNAPDLVCLIKESGRPQLSECQMLRANNLTEYCLKEDCSFMESNYDKCGFDLHNCNIVRSACNAHFRTVIDECNNSASQNGAILGLMLITVLTVLAAI